jgi:hypothetical protein
LAHQKAGAAEQHEREPDKLADAGPQYSVHLSLILLLLRA